ncbi:hypothetical protein CMO89_01975 [Candidatus Woesearchaeota archaeon]|nr:hypothetical protein [Candidatus Woesearchaeota archaeon]|tara:strand:+ start:6317 stop:7516 length:1200 start_codon:yes stop_codon:yes gene_type:complete
MFNRKKGQTSPGGQAASLIGLILLLIVFYIVFLPPSEREALLDGDGDEDDGDDDNGENINETLLSEAVGTLSYLGKDKVEKTIPNIYLSEATNAKEIEKFNPFYIKNSWFDKKSKTLSFNIDNLENTDNFILSFKARTHKGILTIKLNERVIYEYSVNKLDVGPIKLKKDLLKENDNVLEFSVSGIGAKFWKTNEYSIEDTRIFADITDLSRQKSQNIFILTSGEYQNINKAKIRMIPYCSGQESVGVLNIWINNHDIYSSLPVCDDPIVQEIPIDIINIGENNIVFKSDDGSYSVEQVRLTFDLKETKSVTYFFELEQEDYDDITNEDKSAYLKLEFVDDDEPKEAEISVNGHKVMVDQTKPEYSRRIDHWVKAENNYVIIKPKTLLKIVSMDIYLED